MMLVIEKQSKEKASFWSCCVWSCRSWPLLLSVLLLVVASTNIGAATFADLPLDASSGNVNFLFTGQGKPSIANDIEATEKGGKKSDAGSGKHGSENRGSSKGNNSSAEGRAAKSRANAARQSPMLDVVFITGAAGAEIFVQAKNGRLQSLGQSGAGGRLSRRMPRGVYNITASRAGYNAQHQQIEVRPGNTAFNFNLTGQPLVAGGSNSNSASGISEDVIKRYLDPKRTDSVSASDWQLVQAQTSVAFAQNPNNARVKAQSLFAQGQLAYLRGDYAAALVAFNNSALALPSSGLAFYGLGNAYLATNQLAEALSAYLRAVEISGGMAMAYKGAGDVFSRQGKSKEALNYYERARQMGYSSNNTSLSAARTMMKMKRWSAALKELTEISRTQSSSDLFISIGDCYYELQQPLSAAPAYRRATQLDPKSAIAYAKYGEVMYEGREYAAAVEALERSLALDPAGTQINRARTRRIANQAAEKMRNMR